MCYTLSLTVERAKNHCTFCSHPLAVSSESNSKRACSTKIANCVKQDGGPMHALFFYSHRQLTCEGHRNHPIICPHRRWDNEENSYQILPNRKKENLLGTNPEPHPHHYTCQDHVLNSQASDDPLWRVVGGLTTSGHVWWAEAYCEVLCSATSRFYTMNKHRAQVDSYM